MKALLMLAVLLMSVSGQAQEWSPDQEELWAVVSQSWVDDTGETGMWPDAFVHDNVVAWGADWPVPRGKKSMSKWTRYRDANSDMLEYELFPLAIVVEGSTGVAHYSVVAFRKNSEGKSVRSVEGVIETLHKDNGVWKYLSLGGFSIDDGS